jgi:hypothetical protein
VPSVVVVVLDPGRNLGAGLGFGGEVLQAAQLELQVECQDSITALSSADPGRPIDWRTPSRPQAARTSPAVYSLPWSVCRMTPSIASGPPRTATAIASAA